MCHILLLLPLFALPVFWLLPLPAATLLYGITLGFSGWMYYALMRTLHQPAACGREALLNGTGTVLDAAAGRAMIGMHGETWSARYRGELHPEDQVEVIGVEGLVLRVRPFDVTQKAAVPACSNMMKLPRLLAWRRSSSDPMRLKHT